MKKITALAIGGMMLLNSTSFAFSDLAQSHWAYKSVMDMQEKGIVSGFEDNTFRPGDSLTREQFITMAVKGLEVEKPDLIIRYEDVDGRWSKDYVETAGYTICDLTDTNFRPTETALREDVAMSIVRLNNLENEEYSLETLNRFSDKSSISSNRKKYVAIAVEKGYMSGNADATFAPKKVLTRAEGAAVVLNMLNAKDNQVSSKWDLDYISNVDGLVKVQLRKISDTEVSFYIRGKKEDLFATNNSAILTDETAKYEYDIFDNYGEMNFRFDGDDLIIETSGYEGLEVFSGRYKVDDGSISTIERVTPVNPLEGTYTLGAEVDTSKLKTYEEYEKVMNEVSHSLSLTISKITDTSAELLINGIANGGLIVIYGNLEKSDNKWIYTDDIDGSVEFEVELTGDKAIVTGISENRKDLSGEYSRVNKTLEEEYNEYEEQIDTLELGEGVFVTYGV